jgi:hypothetical protein
MIAVYYPLNSSSYPLLRCMLPHFIYALLLSRFRNPQQNEAQDDSITRSETAVAAASNELLHLKIIIAPRFCIILNLQVSYFDSGLQVKEKLLKKLASLQTSPSRSLPSDIHAFRLVRSCTKELFQDFDSILSSHVKNHEEFILTIKRTDGHMNRLLNVQTQRGPSEKEILNRTKNFAVVRSSVATGLNMSLDSAFLQGDLQHDLRKILSEIAKYSAYILGSLPYAEKLIRYYRQKILHNLNNHQDIVKILIDMGFRKKSVMRALRLQGNNYTLALDWLVENVSKEGDAAAAAEEDRGGGGQSNNSNMELSNESNGFEEEGEEEEEDNCGDTYKKHFYTRPFSSTNSIFYPKHKAIVSICPRVCA